MSFFTLLGALCVGGVYCPFIVLPSLRDATSLLPRSDRWRAHVCSYTHVLQYIIKHRFSLTLCVYNVGILKIRNTNESDFD